MRKLISCSSCPRRTKDWKPSTESIISHLSCSVLCLFTHFCFIFWCHINISQASLLQPRCNLNQITPEIVQQLLVAITRFEAQVLFPSQMDGMRDVLIPGKSNQPLSTGRALPWKLGKLWDNGLHWELWAPPVQNVLWKTHESMWQFWLRATSTAFVPVFKEQFEDWQNLLTVQSVIYQEPAQENQQLLNLNVFPSSAQKQSKPSLGCCPRNGKDFCAKDMLWLGEGTHRKTQSRLTFSPSAPWAGSPLLLGGAGNPAAHPNPSDCHRETWKIEKCTKIT